MPELFLLVAACVAIGGCVLISLIERRRVRRALLTLWALLPLLAFFALAFSDGCIPSAGVDRCYWVGFGLVLLVLAGLPAWWAGMATGLVAVHFWRKRKAP